MTPEYLKGPSNLYGARAGTLIHRLPLLYGPSSTAELNEARLPFAEDMKGMELAYREQFFTDRQLNALAWARLLQIYLGSWGLALAAVVTSDFLPQSTGSGIAGALACILTWNAIRSHRITKPITIVLYFVGPLLAYFALTVMGLLMANRLIAAIVFGILTLVVYALIGYQPFSFYRDWLYAHPRLKPESRRNPQNVRVAPNLLFLTLILLVAVIVPIFSTTAAIVAILGISIFLIRRELRPLRYLRDLGATLVHVPEMFWHGSVVAARARKIRRDHMPLYDTGVISPHTSPTRRFFTRPLGLTAFFVRVKAILGLYFTYGFTGAHIPGAWQWRLPTNIRRAQGWLLVAPLFFTLTVGLNLFCPYDLLESRIAADFSISVLDRLPISPYNWVYVVIQAIEEGRFGYVWLLPAATALSLFMLPLVLAAAFRPALVAAEALQTEIEGTPDHLGLDDDGRTEWQWYVDRISPSQHEAPDPMGGTIREADHLFLGVEPRAQFPLLLHRKVLSEHCYIVGDTGSGKTALGIMPILMQLIRGRAIPKHEGMSPPAPMVILDLKGDNALFHTVKHEMEERRRRAGIDDPNDPRFAFRFFTPEKGKASCFFNPFQNLRSEYRTEIQLCHLLLDALNLNHGEGYGRSYYSRKNRLILHEALTEEPRPDSIDALFQRLRRFTSGQNNDRGRNIRASDYPEDTFELFSTIHALAQYPMLATSRNVEHPEQSIFMPDLIEHRQVAYFWLPSVMESISVREIGKLAVFAILSAAMDRHRAQAPTAEGEEAEPRQIYLVIDEFQRLAGENFKVILEQARSFGISAILANQTQADLITHDIDLSPTIRSNTRTKMFFAMSDPDDVRRMSEASGEELTIASTLTTGSAPGFALAQTFALKPRLTLNDVLSVTDHPLEFILHVSRSAGYTQFAGMPIVVRTTYPLSKEVYESRSRAPWPEGHIHTVTPKKSPREIDVDAAATAQNELAALIAESGL